MLWPWLLLLGVCGWCPSAGARSGSGRGWPASRWCWPPPRRSRWRCCITRASIRRGSTTAPTPAPSGCCSARRWPWCGRAGRSPAGSTAARATDPRRPGRRRPGGDRRAVWRTNEYSAVPVSRRARAAVAGHGARRRRPARTRPAGSGGVLGWARCAGWACAPTASTCGTQPIIVLTTPATATACSRCAPSLQVAASVLLAALSWRYVEEPIRHGALGRLWAAARRLAGARAVLPASPLTAGLVLPPSASWDRPAVALAGVRAGRASGRVGTGAGARRPAGPSVGASARVECVADDDATTSSRRRPRRGQPRPASLGRRGDRVPAPTAPTACRHAQRPAAPSSTSATRPPMGLISSNYLPDPGQRIAAQYARVGGDRAAHGDHRRHLDRRDAARAGQTPRRVARALSRAAITAAG